MSEYPWNLPCAEHITMPQCKCDPCFYRRVVVQLEERAKIVEFGKRYAMAYCGGADADAGREGILAFLTEISEGTHER